MSIGRTGSPAPAVEEAIRYAVSRGAFVVIAGGNTFDEGNAVEVLSEIASRVSTVPSLLLALAGTWSTRAIRRPATTSRSRPPAATSRRAARQPASCSRRSTTTSCSRSSRDLHAMWRPASTCSASSSSRARRWRRRTCPDWPRLLYEQGVTRPAAIEAAIVKFAVDKGAPGRDNEFGHGLIDARNTLRGLGLAR